MKIEVRGSSDPWHLLGTIDVPEAYVKLGRSVTFPIYPLSFCARTGKPEYVVFNVAKFCPHPDSDHGYLALKSGDLPIETLRRVPGFVEDGS